MCIKKLFSKTQNKPVAVNPSTAVKPSGSINNSENQVTIICQDNVFTLKPDGNQLGIYCNDELVASITPNGRWNKED